MNRKLTIYLFSTLAIMFALSSNYIEAQSQPETKKQIKYKKARALQTSTAKKINDIYKNTLDWWNLEEVQNAKDMFCERFAKKDLNFLKSWENQFDEFD